MTFQRIGGAFLIVLPMRRSSMLLAIALVSVFVLSGCAGTPMMATGTTSVLDAENFTETPIGDEGNRCLVEVDTILGFTGAIEGQADNSAQIVIEGPCGHGPGTFEENGWYAGTFYEGTVNGVGGTFDLIGHFTVNGEDPDYRGEIVIVEGYGELADLQGIVIESSENVVDTLYAGNLYFPGAGYQTAGDEDAGHASVIEFEAIDVACPDGNVVLSDERMVAGTSAVEAFHETGEHTWLADAIFFPEDYPESTWNAPGEGMELSNGGFLVLHRGSGTGEFEGATIEYFVTQAEEEMDLPCEPAGPVAKIQGVITLAGE